MEKSKLQNITLLLQKKYKFVIIKKNLNKK